MSARSAVVAVVLTLAGCSAAAPAGHEPPPGHGRPPSQSPAAVDPVDVIPDGRWRRVYRQKGLANGANFLDIVADGSDAWAVGERVEVDYHESVLVHWDGRQWRRLVQELPERGRSRTLSKVDASAPGNVWVVAEDNEGGDSGLLHFDGRRWSFLPDEIDENDEPVSTLEVIALGHDQAWTFGERWAKHFDGRKWGRYETPVTTNAASALSPQDIWAVGATADGPAAAHFDGRSWQRTPLPPVAPAGTFDAQLTAVLAVAADDVWAVGSYSTSDSRFWPLLYRWNGTAWRALALKEGRLTGVAQDGGGSVWIAGDVVNPELSHDDYFLLTHAGGRWSQVSSKLPLTALTQASGGRRLWGLAEDEIVEYR
ncbi:hypothetical protein [Nonomuraea sp. B19D2]|uniref:hypothetical protein n=1 Tax=Nonomuraea sp. B19D2 TaxID=3159561 RepID=UPI0032DA68DF